ncbi:hypothetical protein WN55_04316 [Dufourea novaeangliae]|uniref:Uncharacterized protein n=1 Tax=Dufourea novaeangliae TaxID=178035 RepID=A0A154PLR2_DUFNO|nr:hypothetical protein WN55_04316 [Dufourea novaeangliae]
MKVAKGEKTKRKDEPRRGLLDIGRALGSHRPEDDGRQDRIEKERKNGDKDKNRATEAFLSFTRIWYTPVHHTPSRSTSKSQTNRSEAVITITINN